MSATKANFCTGTSVAKLILDYYIKLETCNQDYILNSLQETQKLLKEKDEYIKSLNFYQINQTIN